MINKDMGNGCMIQNRDHFPHLWPMAKYIMQSCLILPILIRVHPTNSRLYIIQCWPTILSPYVIWCHAIISHHTVLLYRNIITHHRVLPTCLVISHDTVLPSFIIGSCLTKVSSHIIQFHRLVVDKCILILEKLFLYTIT